MSVSHKTYAKYKSERLHINFKTTFQIPVLQNANAQRKISLEIYFVHLGSKEINSISRHAAQSLFYFPPNAIYYVILSFHVRTVFMFFINHVLKLKYPPLMAEGRTKPNQQYERQPILYESALSVTLSNTPVSRVSCPIST